MYCIEESFRTGTAMFQAVMFAAIFESYRPAIEIEVEKELGRKMSNDEWRYLICESFKKVQVDRQQEQSKQWFQLLDDRKIIRDFVWNTKCT
jgi:hypothetical protein